MLSLSLLLLSLSPFLQLFYAYEESRYPVLYASVVVYRTLYTNQLLRQQAKRLRKQSLMLYIVHSSVDHVVVYICMCCPPTQLYVDCL